MHSKQDFDGSDPFKVLQMLAIPLDHCKYIRLMWPLCNRIRTHIENKSLRKAVKRLETAVTLSDVELLFEVRNVKNAVCSLLYEVIHTPESKATHVLYYATDHGFERFKELLWFFTTSLEAIEGIGCDQGRAIAVELISKQIDILQQNNT
ncbi:MAG: hypothetical protein MUC83_05870 [Pirellula sp.]|jgi:hypothetical protein|nr:hypothetical protein [Pirellula sp.]